MHLQTYIFFFENYLQFDKIHVRLSNKKIDMELLDKIREKARQLNKTIVLAEGTEERTLKAADMAVKEKIAKIILLGNPEVINQKAKQLGLVRIADTQIIDPKNHAKKDAYIEYLFNLRKAKGLTKDDAAKLVEDPLYLGPLLIVNGEADGQVAGAINATSNVVRPAIQIIKTAPGISVVSSLFVMVFEKNKKYTDNGVLIYADCGVFPYPNEKELAEIAITTARSARSIAGLDPRLAMLSFSTKGSAKHPMIDVVINATRIAKELDPTLKIDGELQGDAALVASVAKSKAPGSEVAGNANVLIFPNLDAGNIAYKLTQYLADAIALGPILQGLAKPVNDLSRGCTAEDIFDTIAITSNQTVND